MTAIEDARADLQEALDWIAPYQEAVNSVSLTLRRDQVVALLEATAPPTDDEREALADRLERKYEFFKRMSFDGSEHETMILLREAASVLRRQGPITDAQVRAALRAYCRTAFAGGWGEKEEAHMRAALGAARDA